MADGTRLIVQESEGKVRVFLQWGDGIPEPQGAASDFEPPLTAEELEDLRWYLESYLKAPYGVYADRGDEIAGRLETWGERLFASLFSDGEARDAYVQARESDQAQLWLSSKTPAFLGLPWELMRDPRRGVPLALELGGFYRTVPSAPAPALTPPGEQLRVLMVIARPYGQRDVGFRMIARHLIHRLKPVSGQVDVEVLRPPTFKQLKSKLAAAREVREPFHVLHFDGHGTFGTEAPAPGGGGPLSSSTRHWYEAESQGFLVFETEEGSEHPVSAESLGPVLADSGVPLLVLNACQSAMLDSGARPEASVATRLLTGGAAATVAMGYSVYAVAAAEFVSVFYEALFAGRSVSEAVTAGRRQMQAAKDRPSPKGPLPLEDWIVPVHYARRPVSFPQLQRRETGLPDLQRVLEGLRKPTAQAPETEGVHAEGDLAESLWGFFGRDAEFLELERALRLHRVMVLHGVGGTGKTELAKGFARWLQSSGGLDDPRLVFFHSFEPGVATFGLQGVLASVGLRLLGPDFARLGPEQREAAILDVLRQHRILLVWDNFETVHSLPAEDSITPALDEAGREAVQRFLARVAREGKGGVLITSRSPESWLGEVFRLEVLGLDEDAAGELADRLLAGVPGARERRLEPEFPRLLEALSGHPLSLRLILPRLAEVASPRELLEGLAGEGLSAGSWQGEEGRLQSLGACVHYSYRHLDSEAQRRLVALVLFEGVADVDVLGFFSAKDGVPERFAGWDRESWKEALDSMVAAGLLTDLDRGMYQIHPALPHYLHQLWNQSAEEAFEAEHEAAEVAMIEAMAGLGGWLFQQITSGSAETAFAVLKVLRRSLGRAAGEALRRSAFGSAQAMLQPLNNYWDQQGLGEEAGAWVDRCREAAEDSAGEIPDLESSNGALWLFMVGTQANRYLLARRLEEAEETYDSIRRQLETMDGGGAQSHLATTYHQLGMVSEERGDLSTASSWYEKSLSIKESLGDRSGMASSYHQLGMVSCDGGDLSTASSWYQKSLSILESLGDRPGMAKSYHQLGIVSQLEGDLSSAASWYEKSLSIKESLGDRQGMASSYHQLGMLAQLRGDLSTALSWCEKSLSIYESLGDRSGMASSYHQFGIVSQKRGDLSTASSWYQKSLSVLESFGDRPSMAMTYALLSTLSEQSGAEEEALNWMVRAIGLFGESRHLAQALSDLARFTAKLGMNTLQDTWQQVYGEGLPESIREQVEGLMEAGEG